MLTTVNTSTADIGSTGSRLESSVHRMSSRGELTRPTRGFKGSQPQWMTFWCMAALKRSTMLERTREKGIKLNKDKSSICVTEVSYFGHKLTREGIKPDPNRVKAMKEMSPPRSRAGGWAWSPTSPSWHPAFQRQSPRSDNGKRTGSSCGTQTKTSYHRSPAQCSQTATTQEVKLQVDASKCGLGALLLQGEKSVASKTLRPKKGTLRFKELDAVLCGRRRFHQHLDGRQVTVESDHKPLESIMWKPLAAAPPPYSA